MTRAPAVSGTFYPSTERRLISKIESISSHPLGAHINITQEKDQNTAGVIVPHASYDYSGPCASHAFNYLASLKPPDLYLLLGGSHSGSPSAFSSEDWETPSGILHTDKSILNILSGKTIIPISDIYHTEEHSIEVLAVLLSYLQKEQGRATPAVFLHLSKDRDMKDTGERIAEALEGKKVHLLISSDFVHYGPRFYYTPFKKNMLESVHSLDHHAIEYITDMDAPGFMNLIKETGATICGYLAIAAGLSFLKSRGIKKGALLKYYTSADISGDESNTVSYASISF